MPCRECGAEQLEGALFCTECGRSLLEAPPHLTEPLPFISHTQILQPLEFVENELEPSTKSQSLTLIIPGTGQRLTLELMGRLRLGRAEPADEDDDSVLDLSHAQAAEKGVSRFHATLQLCRQGVALIDMDSTNGTRVNNFTLPPHKPVYLNNGDEIYLGNLLIHVFFSNNR